MRTILPDSDRLKRHQESLQQKERKRGECVELEFNTTDEIRKHKKNCK